SPLRTRARAVDIGTCSTSHTSASDRNLGSIGTVWHGPRRCGKNGAEPVERRPVDGAERGRTEVLDNGPHTTPEGARAVSESTAARMRRPSWRDPRLGVGILLVVASVALGSWVVARADATVTVYQAAQALTPGEPVDVEDLRPVQIRLDGVEETYLVPG